MSKDSKLTDYLPFYDLRTGEMAEICRIIEPYIKAIWEENEYILRESFVITAEDIGLERLEAMLGLDGRGISVPQRRQNIIFKLMGDLPYTMCTLYDRFQRLFWKYFELEYGQEPYTINVRIGFVHNSQYKILMELLYRIVPANIGINFEILRNRHIRLKRNRHCDLKPYIHFWVRNDLALSFGRRDDLDGIYQKLQPEKTISDGLL